MNDLISKRDTLELNAYEALEKRNAVLREIKSLIGPDLKIGMHKEYSVNIDKLHNNLANQTTTCLAILSEYNKVINELKCVQVNNLKK